MADPDTIDEAFADEEELPEDGAGGLNDGDMETLEEGSMPTTTTGVSPDT